MEHLRLPYSLHFLESHPAADGEDGDKEFVDSIRTFPLQFPPVTDYLNSASIAACHDDYKLLTVAFRSLIVVVKRWINQIYPARR